ncbi:MAG TPA: hypothetical protein VNP04_22070 [Alphaproteobacteria bacterium]|nr:hypothetical protein [Alphaproteobacteria bacterium]
MVTNRRLTFALLAELMLIAWAAHATTLFTPPLVPDGDNQLDCYLLNVSGQTRSATIEVLTREGRVLESIDVTLHSGTEAVASVLADAQPRYCKFVVEGNKLHFRGSILVRQPGVGSVSALSAE